jgi:hypothetical protein
MTTKMESKNLIRIDDLNIPVYRIFPLDRIEQLFGNRELVLVNTSKWEDPFENFLLRCRGVLEDGTPVSLKEIADSWFGQCWTTNADTDAMWRIYSHDKQSIRVKTTVGKLAAALWDPVDQYSPLKYFIGKVRYLERAEIESFLKSTSFYEASFGGQNDGFAETLLTKRPEFQHESEVRILACELETQKASERKGLYRVSIDPHQLVEEVCIDPRVSDPTELECLESKIKGFGYRGPVVQSDLYKLSITTIPLSPPA